jgi:hypothetical protein
MTNEPLKWMVMVYISADGVLANFAVESLKQLKRAGKSADVAVVAQVDANGPIRPKRYVFDARDHSPSIEVPTPTLLDIPRGDGTPDPKNLTEFINDATKQYPDRRYCLFLWGHGTELLLDDDATEDPNGTNVSQPVKRYLTPSNLKNALAKTDIANAKKKIAILGMDACSMDMVEIASELGDFVEFMVASQEDVPDLSFPYEAMLSGLSESTSTEEASKMIPAVYKDTYADYIADPSTGISGLSLASLRLEKVRDITGPLKDLAKGLLDLSFEEVARKKILSARQNSQAFVFGLFADLADFCEKLGIELQDVQASTGVTSVRNACKQIRDAIARRDGLVVENQNVLADRCQGVSIYFPYQTNEPVEEVPEFRVKGGTNRPLKGGTNRPLKERTARIKELEDDFAALVRFDAIGWNKFIKGGWSFILATEEPDKLDDHYSAQRCAQNLGSFGPSVMASAA